MRSFLARSYAEDDALKKNRHLESRASPRRPRMYRTRGERTPGKPGRESNSHTVTRSVQAHTNTPHGPVIRSPPPVLQQQVRLLAPVSRSTAVHSGTPRARASTDRDRARHHARRRRPHASRLRGRARPRTASSRPARRPRASVGVAAHAGECREVRGDVLGELCLLYTSPSPRDS